jgi:hypothetical protein
MPVRSSAAPKDAFLPMGLRTDAIPSSSEALGLLRAGCASPGAAFRLLCAGLHLQARISYCHARGCTSPGVAFRLPGAGLCISRRDIPTPTRRTVHPRVRHSDCYARVVHIQARQSQCYARKSASPGLRLRLPKARLSIPRHDTRTDTNGICISAPGTAIAAYRALHLRARHCDCDARNTTSSRVTLRLPRAGLRILRRDISIARRAAQNSYVCRCDSLVWSPAFPSTKPGFLRTTLRFYCPPEIEPSREAASFD